MFHTAPPASNLHTFRAINPAVTHTNRVFGASIHSLDLGEESPELFTLHTAANSPEADESDGDSEGIAYNPIDFVLYNMYCPNPIADAAVNVRSRHHDTCGI